MDWDCGLFHNTGAGGAACGSSTVTFGYLDNRGLDAGALMRDAKKPDKSPALVCDHAIGICLID